MPTPPDTITRPTDVLLDPSAFPGDQLAAAHALRDALAQLAGWSEADPGAEAETPVDGGVAISPVDAARCIPEYRRTAAFLQGVLQAVEAASARVGDGPVEVLYAGCGPLAPLAVALAHRAPRARFWPVDIHDRNVASVRRLIAAAGLADRFGEVAAADASRHRWPVPGHVGVAEVLQRGLEKEPQVAVTAHLATQLVPDGILVPRRIALDALLFDPATEFDLEASRERVRVPLAPVLELTRESAADLRGGAEAEFDYAEPAGLHVMVATRIEVGDGVVLGDHACSLTLPWVAHALGLSGPGRRGRIRYLTGARPRLEAEPLQC